jgi:acetate kinase
MNTLVLNSGSSSLKYKLFDMPEERLLAAGVVERIGEDPGRARLTIMGPDGRRESSHVACMDHSQALDMVLASLDNRTSTTAADPGDITLVGHRLVHGGELFHGPTVVDERALRQMTSLQGLAPLHMPPALAVLRACQERLPAARHVACFDTTFYRTMPAHAHRYAVPRDWHTRHGVRRFGFHGLSHEYVARSAARMMGKPPDALKVITAHLGNGASITAVDRGRVLDTSMGFTPLEGLIMGTRCGYLDPAVLLHIQGRTGMDLAQMVGVLNHQSGLLAVSGIGRDLRTIMAARAHGHPDAALAVDMYVHTLRKYIGAYHFALSGAHALVFTGGVGENSADIRSLVLSGWRNLGLDLNPDANRRTVNGRSGRISTDTSPVAVLVIPTDEERLIARQSHILQETGTPEHSL